MSWRDRFNQRSMRKRGVMLGVEKVRRYPESLYILYTVVKLPYSWFCPTGAEWQLQHIVDFLPLPSHTDGLMQSGEIPVRLEFEPQGLAKEQSMACQLCKWRSNACIFSGCARFHVLSFWFRCPILNLHMERRLNVVVSQFTHLEKWMKNLVPDVAHNPYRVLNTGWHDPLKHSLTHKRAKTDCFTLNLANASQLDFH